MRRSGALINTLIAIAAFTSLALAPIPAFAQRGGGHGSGGFHGGGGGFYGRGFHSGGGTGFYGGGFRGRSGFHGGGGGFRGSGGFHSGGFRGGSGADSYGMGGRSYGGFGASRNMTGRNGGFGGNRTLGAFGNRSSFANHSTDFHSAMRDGQWHSFGNSGSSARFTGGRNSGGWTNSSFAGRNAGIRDGAWHSFGPSKSASPGSGSRFAGAAGTGRISRSETIRAGAGLVGARSGGSPMGNSVFAGPRFGHSTSRFFFGNSRLGSTTPLIGGSRFGFFGGSGSKFVGGLGLHGNAFGPFRTGYRWGGYGWRGFWPGLGWGHDFGWGWGLGWRSGWGWGGWGFGWPFWGAYWWAPGWTFGWNPWWYDPFWYSPWPPYGYYPGYYLYDDPLPYYSDSSYVYDSPGSYLTTPLSNHDDFHVDSNAAGSVDSSGSDQNQQAPQPEAAPAGPAQLTQAQQQVVSQPTHSE